MSRYALAPAYAAVQYWSADKSDLLEVRRVSGEAVTEVPDDIPTTEAERLLKLGAIVEASEAEPAPAEPGGPVEPAGNASREDWVVYADSLGLTVEPGSGREDIKQLVADSRR